jgi:hypothetical protein
MKLIQEAIRAALLCALAASSTASAATTPVAPAKAAPAMGAAHANPHRQVAAEPPPSLPALTAEQVVERNLTARGTAAAWQRVQAMTFTGQMDAGHERKDGGTIATNPVQSKAEARARAKLILEGKAPVDAPKVIRLPFTMDVARPNKVRVEIPFAGQTAVQVYDGSAGWKLRPYLGRHEVEAYSADELRIAGEQQELDGPLASATAKGTKVELDGTDRVNGKPAYRLKLTMKGGAVRRLWIDAGTFLDARLETAPRHWNGKLRPVSVYFSNYGAEGGLQVAHSLETRIDGTKESDRVDIDKVVVNPTLPADRFTKPK